MVVPDGGGILKRAGLAWLPDDESDEAMLSSGFQYQSVKFNEALRYSKAWRTAIDIGAHCGLWTVQMGKYYTKVECFEPLPRHIKCWRKNCIKDFMHLHPIALGESVGSCHINVIEGSSGRSYVTGEGNFPMQTLDGFGFKGVDLIKVDVEGYEYFVLKGAEKTLIENQPVVVVEQKPGMAQKYGLGETDAVKYLESLGAKLRCHMYGDYILSWA